MEIYTMRATIPTRVLQRKTYNGPPSPEPRLKLPDCLVSVLMSQPLDFIVIRRSMLRAIRCICNFIPVASRFQTDYSFIVTRGMCFAKKFKLKCNFFFLSERYKLLSRRVDEKKEDGSSFRFWKFQFLKRFIKECLIHSWKIVMRFEWITRRWELHCIKKIMLYKYYPKHLLSLITYFPSKFSSSNILIGDLLHQLPF